MKTQALNEDKAHQYILLDDLGYPLPFSSGEQFTASVHAGLDRPALFIPTCSPATNGADGKLNVNITRTMILDIEKGKYHLQVKDSLHRERIKDIIEFYEPVQVTSAFVGKVYCSYQDMLNIFPTLGAVKAKNDETNFRRQREEVFNWLNTQVMAKFNETYSPYLYHGWYRCCNYYSGAYLGYDSEKIQTLLNDGHLVTSQEVDNGVAVRIASLKSVADVLTNKLTNTDVGDLDYRTFAQECETRALTQLFGWRPKIDDDGTIISTVHGAYNRPPPVYHYPWL